MTTSTPVASHLSDHVTSQYTSDTPPLPVAPPACGPAPHATPADTQGFFPPHSVMSQRDFLACFGAALTERVATASPPVYRGPKDTPWAPLRLLKRKPLGAQGLMAQAGASALRGLKAHGIPGQPTYRPARPRRRGLGLVAEMATGKSLLSLAMLGLADEEVTRERAASDQRPQKARFFPAVVLSPPIVVEKWAREAINTLPTARPVVIRQLRTKAEVAAFRRFDPSFTGAQLSAIGCVERVTTRIQQELAQWRIQRDKALREGRTPPRKPCHLAILSTSVAKLGPAWSPVYLLRALRDVDAEGKVRALRDPATGDLVVAPCCPSCFAPLKDEARAARQERERQKRQRQGKGQTQNDAGDEDDEAESVYLTEAELLGQRGPLAKRTCAECGATLWQMVADTTRWQATPPPLDGMRRVAPLPLPSREYHPPCVTSTFERRYPLADYLRKRHRGLFRSLICDEAHQFKGAGTAQGFAAASLVDACNPGGSTLFLTGTLFSGYCSDLYPMLWRLLPELRATFGYGDLKRWVDLYGVRQKVLKIREGRSGRREDGAKSKRREDKPLIKELPGISPLVLRHLLDSCLFLELADVAPDLPPYSEEAVVAPLGELLGPVYSAFERETTASLKEMLARYDNSGLAAWFQGLMVQPNLPWRDFVTAAPSGAILGSAEPLPEDMTYPKERTLLDFVRGERAAGRRMLIFVEHTGAYDLLPRLKALLEADDVRWRQEYQEYRERQADVVENYAQHLDVAGASAIKQVASATHALTKPPTRPIRVATLRSSTVASAQREAWLARTVEEGCDVLLCHSGLVEVGLDLLAFPTIVCDEVIFSTTRMRQATRRSYRPGQTLPVKVVQLVYDHSMEARGLTLIAAKIKSSLMVEGKLPGEGLSSYGQSDNQGGAGGQGDLLLELARSVLADEAGATRDVAGSLEATFRELAQVEQEQDAYIGDVELPVVEAAEAVEAGDMAEISETRAPVEEGVDHLAQLSEAPTAQVGWLFSRQETLAEPGTEPAPLLPNHTTLASSPLSPAAVQETEHPWVMWRRLHAPLPTTPPACTRRSRSEHLGVSQRRPDPPLDDNLWSPQPAPQWPMSDAAPSSGHTATGQQQPQTPHARASSEGVGRQVTDTTAAPPRLQPTQATLWGEMAE